MSHFDEMLEQAVLIDAWARVRGNAGGPGVDGVTLRQYGQNLFSRLTKLAAVVREERYVAKPLLQREYAQPNKPTRLLAIPTVQDRILQSAAALVLGPVLEPEFEPVSYGYRPGRSVRDAIEAVMRLRDQGYCWVVDADIDSFFDNVDHSRLLSDLARYVDDPRVSHLVAMWIRARIKAVDGHWIDPERGIPQGSPVSPLLANMYLDELDEMLSARGFRIVRYADDFVVLCRSEVEAQGALELTDEIVQGLALRLNAEKSRVSSFEVGFRFLGVDFLRETLNANPTSAPWLLPKPTTEAFQYQSGPKLESPVASALQEVLPKTSRDRLPDASTDEPEWLEETGEEPPYLRTLHLISPGLSLVRTGDRLGVTRGGDRLREIPIHKIDQVFVVGNALVSTSALELCTENGVTVLMADWRGVPFAVVESPGNQNTELRRKQYALQELPTQVLSIGRALVCAKIAGQRGVLRRYLRNHPNARVEGALKELELAANAAREASTVGALLGHEGNASRAHFAGMRALIPDEFAFDGRHPRAPANPVDAMLSYAYSVVYSNILTLIQRRGLDPFVGFLHMPRAGHAALASDLIEPYRAPVVDTLILGLILQRRVKLNGFEVRGDRRSWMRDGTRRTLIHAIEGRLAGRAPGGMDWRRRMAVDVVAFDRFVRGESPEFKPFRP